MLARTNDDPLASISPRCSGPLMTLCEENWTDPRIPAALSALCGRTQHGQQSAWSASNPAQRSQIWPSPAGITPFGTDLCCRARICCNCQGRLP